MNDKLIKPIYYVNPISEDVYSWLDECESIEEKRSIELANRADELILDLKTDIGLLVDEKYTNIFIGQDIETMINDVVVEIMMSVINHTFYPDELLTYAYFSLEERFAREIKKMEDDSDGIAN